MLRKIEEEVNGSGDETERPVAKIEWALDETLDKSVKSLSKNVIQLLKFKS